MPSPIRSLSRRAALPLLSAFFAAAAWGAPALQVEESTVLAASPAAVWKVIGEFNDLSGWHPAIATTEMVKGRNNAKGAVRSLTTKDGAKIVEELLAYDGKGHSMRYRFIESPLPVKDYVATLAVKPEGTGSRIVWTSQFNRADNIDDAKARSLIAGIYRAGFDGTRAKLGEAAKH